MLTTDKHSFYTGATLGALIKAGLTALPLPDKSGNFTNQLLIDFGKDNIYILTLEHKNQYLKREDNGV
jgi:hypothetical protein